MKQTNYFKALILSILLTLGFVVKTLQAQTDSVAVQADPTYTFVDLYTGQPIQIWYDPAKYMTFNKITNQPVEFYVINNTDTVHGVTGLVVNGMILKEKDNKYKLDNGKVKWDGDELKIKENSGRKVKWEKGQVKIKDWRGKTKAGHKGTQQTDQWGKVKWKEGEWMPEPVL